MESNKSNQDIELAKNFIKKLDLLNAEISKNIIGQKDIIKEVLISIFSGGHALLVGVPGLAKTLLVNTISKSLGLNFSRIQFTPDLMPSDIIGSEILNNNREFQFIKGPLFANIILADEINRTPPKTQSALLEAMQEKSITSGGKTYKIQNPFFVLATQNPIEQEGTYPLPEAQLDRFMFNIWLDYTSFEDEIKIVKQTTGMYNQKIKPIMSAEEIIEFQQIVRKIPVADNVYEYAVKLTAKTRPNGEYATDIVNEYVSWGAGTRASQFLILGAKCNALMNKKYTPDIEDVNQIAKPILRHRVILNYKAEAEGYTIDKIIESLLID